MRLRNSASSSPCPAIMTEKFKSIPSVFIAATRENKVVLQLRQNTGYLDGYYDLPSGHVEPNEALIDAALRELQEEVGIVASKNTLSLFHICQHFATPGKPYQYHFFKTSDWRGEPKIGEPDKILDVGLFDLNELPDNTTSHVITALGDLASQKVGFSIIN